MAETDETILLRDASLQDQVRALVAGIAAHPDRIAVSTYDVAGDPYHLSIELYATTAQQLRDWIAEVRRRLAATLDITDAPTSLEVDEPASA